MLVCEKKFTSVKRSYSLIIIMNSAVDSKFLNSLESSFTYAWEGRRGLIKVPNKRLIATIKAFLVFDEKRPDTGMEKPVVKKPKEASILYSLSHSQ